MIEVPKIVFNRLRAASLKRALPGQEPTERAHPDADLLTAFTEQTLPATEREGLLDHLSLCGDCRDVIALALPAAEIPAKTNTSQATRLPAKTALGWLSALTTPSLRWAALAGAAAIIVAVLVARSGKLNETKLTAANLRVANPAIQAPDHTVIQAPAHQLAPSPTNRSTNQLSMGGSVAVLKSGGALPLPQPKQHRSKRVKSGHDMTPALQAESGMTPADNKTDQDPLGKMADAQVNRGTKESVEVATGSPAVQAETSSAPDVLMAQNGAQAVIKAKPAAQTEASQLQEQAAAPTVQPSATNPTWLITAGVLQRSLDGGHTWQNAVESDQMLLCYASREQDVWTGGHAGTLFHSTDGGLTWVQVRPSIKAQQLRSDITHIELRSRLETLVSTVTGEIWISGNDGATWEKK